MTTYLELSRRDTKIHCYNKTGYQPCGFHSRFFTKSLGQPVHFHLSLVTSSVLSIISQNPLPKTDEHTRIDLVPEFDLSIPTAGDDLGRFMRMPQGAYAHLVMSFDPVVKLGGLPVPNVELSIRIARDHIAGREEKVQKQTNKTKKERERGWKD